MIETGTILQNRYRIDKQIGQGGMGKVYVATDERFKSTVAIKETVFEDTNLRKAFEREARLLNSLKHAALPRVSDHFDENEGQFLVMEFISGEDLAERMEKNGEAFSLETVLDWANQLCAALEYLHAQDIIHRDIKPQNLKLTPSGQIVLLDFGLAKGNATDAPHQTAAKSIFGFSRSYASLEQIQGAGTEPRSDLYSLSATLYHLLTGIPPADALTRAMNVLNKQSDPLIPANLINKEVPKGVAEVLQKAMALNANERPESASAMRSMLDESDKFVDLNAAESAIEKSLTTDFLTQDTKIIGAKTNVSADAPSEVETKIAPVKVSENNPYQTQIIDNKPESRKTFVQLPAATENPKRAKVVGATVFGGLLLIGSIFSAEYFLNSDAPRSNVSAGNANTTVVNAVPANNNFIGNLSEANIVLAEDNTANKSVAETPVRPIETTKSNTKKQSSNSSFPINQKNNNTDSDRIIVDDENDTVEMNGIIFDDNGIRDKKTGKSLIPVPPKPNEPPTQPNYMSPEQMQKLERLKEKFKNNKKRIVVIKTPTPEK